MAATPELNEPSRTFHMEEYKQLRSEVIGLLARIELLFRYSMIVAASTFAWLLSNSMAASVTANGAISACLKQPSLLLVFAWLIPPTFVFCAGMMARITRTRVGEISEYLQRLERVLGHCALGWEAHLASKRSILTPMTETLWWLLLALTVAGTTAALATVVTATGACHAKAADASIVPVHRVARCA